uniref:Claudin n=1 Tax=Eptatretus burgeri TaxID=7764 RepID=A0A8C4R2W3_EPTBU
MANTGCQVFAFVLCFIALVGYSVCIGSNQWKITNRGKAVVVATVLYQGLWKSCAGDTLGSQQCRSYYTVLQLPPYMRASQAMMIIGMILALMGILLSLFGMKCSRIGDDDPAIKGRIIAVGGIMNILASFSVITVISYFAWQVTVDFYNPAVKIKYDYGLALYVGWGACVLSLLGGKSFEEHLPPPQSPPAYINWSDNLIFPWLR